MQKDVITLTFISTKQIKTLFICFHTDSLVWQTLNRKYHTPKSMAEYILKNDEKEDKHQCFFLHFLDKIFLLKM